jgi:hypothetical protein
MRIKCGFSEDANPAFYGADPDFHFGANPDPAFQTDTDPEHLLAGLLMLWLVTAAVFYPGESSVEMVDMRTKKLFLRKIRSEEVALKDLYIGT